MNTSGERVMTTTVGDRVRLLGVPGRTTNTGTSAALTVDEFANVLAEGLRTADCVVAERAEAVAGVREPL
eukprot:6859358-Lingulodinium_polyedra.AAC.1